MIIMGVIVRRLVGMIIMGVFRHKRVFIRTIVIASRVVVIVISRGFIRSRFIGRVIHVVIMRLFVVIASIMIVTVIVCRWFIRRRFIRSEIMHVVVMKLFRVNRTVVIASMVIVIVIF